MGYSGVLWLDLTGSDWLCGRGKHFRPYSLKHPKTISKHHIQKEDQAAFSCFFSFLFSFFDGLVSITCWIGSGTISGTTAAFVTKLPNFGSRPLEILQASTYRCSALNSATSLPWLTLDCGILWLSEMHSQEMHAAKAASKYRETTTAKRLSLQSIS